MLNAAVRQRIPFQFSEDDGLGDGVLDDQEQEEVIETIRKGSANSNALYWTSVQVALSLSLLIHVIYLLSPTKTSPFVDILPGVHVSEPVPFGAALTALQILIHINLGFNTLPHDHTCRRRIKNAALSSAVLPLHPTHLVTILLPLLAPTFALLIGRGPADVVWWSVAGLMTALLALVTKWMRDEEGEIAKLENLRYTARGA